MRCGGEEGDRLGGGDMMRWGGEGDGLGWQE
jgi:hypothetical protein